MASLASPPEMKHNPPAGRTPPIRPAESNVCQRTQPTESRRNINSSTYHVKEILSKDWRSFVKAFWFRQKTFQTKEKVF